MATKVEVALEADTENISIAAISNAIEVNEHLRQSFDSLDDDDEEEEYTAPIEDENVVVDPAAPPQTAEVGKTVEEGQTVEAGRGTETKDTADVEEKAAAGSETTSEPVTPETLPRANFEISDEEAEMFFNRKNQNQKKSYFYKDEAPPVPPSQVERNEKYLARAETAENILGSALSAVERERGGSLLSFNRTVPRAEAEALGRHVSSISVASRPPSLLRVLSADEDAASIHTWASQITETTFFKVPKADPAILAQHSWENLMTSNSPENLQIDLTASHEGLPAAAPPSTEEDKALASRNWDNLRNTLEAEDNESLLTAETPAPESPPRSMGDSPKRRRSTFGFLCKSIGKIRRPRKPKSDSFSLVLGVPPSPRATMDLHESPSNADYSVKIRVEDLTKPEGQRTMEASFDQTVDVDEISHDSTQPSFDITEPDLAEAESLEVVYVSKEFEPGSIDVLPPFPSRMVQQRPEI